jgi:hypothetical protein
VAYRVGSDDGHPAQGQIQFTLTVAATPGASPSPAPAASTAGAASSSEPTLTPAASNADDTGTPWWPWATVGGAVALLAAGVGAALVRRRG